MHTMLIVLTFGVAPLMACPDIKEEVQKKISGNYGQIQDDSLKIKIGKTKKLNRAASAASVFVSYIYANEEKLTHQEMVILFKKGKKCEILAIYVNAKISGLIKFLRTTFVLVKTRIANSSDGEREYQDALDVVAVNGQGDLIERNLGEAAYSSSSSSILSFSGKSSMRCGAKWPEYQVNWKRNAENDRLVSIEERELEFDEKCRIVSSTSKYQYYKITETGWESGWNPDDE